MRTLKSKLLFRWRPWFYRSFNLIDNINLVLSYDRILLNQPTWVHFGIPIGFRIALLLLMIINLYQLFWLQMFILLLFFNLYLQRLKPLSCLLMIFRKWWIIWSIVFIWLLNSLFLFIWWFFGLWKIIISKRNVFVRTLRIVFQVHHSTTILYSGCSIFKHCLVPKTKHLFLY